jgi:hypothetical protein
MHSSFYSWLPISASRAKLIGRLSLCIRNARFQRFTCVQKVTGPKWGPLITVPNVQQGEKLPPVDHNRVMQT